MSTTASEKQMTAQEIADLLEAAVEGSPGVEIRGCNSLELASGQEISFVEGGKAKKAASESRAGCLLVSTEAPALDGRTIIRVQRPRSAFARVVRRLHPPERAEPGVHPTAIVAASVQLGEGVSIGPYAIIDENVQIGQGTVIGAAVSIGQDSTLGSGCLVYPGATISARVAMGNRVILHSGCVVGADGFGYTLEGDHYEKFPQIGKVEIGNDVEIGANACIDRGALGSTIIGDGTKLDNMVHIGHNCLVGKHVVIAAQTGISGGCVIEDYVVMGGQVGISEKAHIGAKAVIGAQCGILPHRKIPPGQTVWGTPSRPHRQHLKKLALVDRLPKIVAELEELRKRIADLEGGK